MGRVAVEAGDVDDNIQVWRVGSRLATALVPAGKIRQCIAATFRESADTIGSTRGVGRRQVIKDS
jgi:hypothetical protein